MVRVTRTAWRRPTGANCASAEGDHWVAGGAVAISSLACGRVVQAIDATGALGDLRDLLSAVAVALIVAELLWLPFLLAGELAAPRLQFSAARWATVFPVGMYAASTFTVGATAIMRPATASAAPARA